MKYAYSIDINDIQNKLACLGLEKYIYLFGTLLLPRKEPMEKIHHNINTYQTYLSIASSSMIFYSHWFDYISLNYFINDILCLSDLTNGVFQSSTDLIYLLSILNC